MPKTSTGTSAANRAAMSVPVILLRRNGWDKTAREHEDRFEPDSSQVEREISAREGSQVAREGSPAGSLRLATVEYTGRHRRVLS